MRMLTLLQPSTYYQFAPGSDVPIPVDNRAAVAAIRLGSTFTTQVAAPGYGTRTYQYTRKDAQGAWGVLVADRSGMLQPWQVA
jgi:hypothetical protein